MALNPIRLSKDWPTLIREAEARGLRSHEVGKLQKFVEEIVKASERVRAAVWTELIAELAAREEQRGERRRILPAVAIPGNGEQKKSGKPDESSVDNSGEGG